MKRNYDFIPETIENKIAEYMRAAEDLLNDLYDVTNMSGDYHSASYVSFICDYVELAYNDVKELKDEMIGVNEIEEV